MKDALSGPVGLLLSDAVYAQEGSRLDRMARDAGLTLRSCTQEQARENPAGIRAAFFSRDLYEGSSLRKPGPLSDAFFAIVDSACDLSWLHVCSSGLDLPQYTTSLQRGVSVTSSSGTTAVPIAQTVLAAILAQSRGFDHWLSAQSRKEWAPLTGREKPEEIGKQRVIVIGAGMIGREIGRLLHAVGFHTTVVRRRATPTPPFNEVIEFSQLDAALPLCDWLVVALPLTPETRNLVDSRRLALLSRDARIVNIARGELIDEAALTQALSSGALRGAYLDTFLEEPLSHDSPLWSLPNVWISPHNSAASQGHEKRVVENFIQQYELRIANRSI